MTNTAPKQTGSTPDSEWRTGVENTITGLSDSLRLMNESIQSLVQSREKKKKCKSKKLVSKKTKSKSVTGVQPDLVQVRAQVESFSQGLSLGSILENVGE